MNWDKKQQTIINYVEMHLQRDEYPIEQDDIVKIAGFFPKDVFLYECDRCCL